MAEHKHRLSKWLDSKTEFWLSVFYVGFVVIALFVMGLYFHHVLVVIDDNGRKNDENLIQAAIVACRRSNVDRRAINTFHESTRIFILNQLSYIKDEQARNAYIEWLQSINTVHVPNCEQEIRSITGRILRERDE